MSDDDEWLCTTLEVEGGQRVKGDAMQLLRMGVAAKDRLWPLDTELKVRFLDGSAELHDKVLAVAREWLQPGVRLKIAAAALGEKTHVRISFTPGSSWSAVGTQAETYHPTVPTMNLGWATLQTPEAKFTGVVLHEWGHALGLLHEHNHPEARIEWKKDVVRAELRAAPHYWSDADIEHNVFETFDASTIITTDFDKVSVMIYPIKAAWNARGQVFTPSPRLSDGDKATIVRLYESDAAR